MTIDERLEAITMNLELTARQAEESRIQIAEARAQWDRRHAEAAAERERKHAEWEQRHAEARAESDRGQSDLRQDIHSLADTVKLFIQAQTEFNRQFREDMKQIARIVARHDDWIHQQGAA